MLIRILFLSLLISVSPILSQEIPQNVSCDKVETNFIIKDFYVKDFSRNLFYIEIKSKNRELLPDFIQFKKDDEKNEYDKAKEKKEEKATSIEKVKFITKIGDKDASRITGSYHYRKGSSILSYELISAENDKSGQTCIRLYDDKYQLMASLPYTIPDRNENAGEQPLITEVTPNADGKKRALDKLFGYPPDFVCGNSAGDLAMLKAAQKMALVVQYQPGLPDLAGSELSLRQEAQNRGWPIQFFSASTAQ
jgi:hypothetical protein